MLHSMARFKWRAPYRLSVPSQQKSFNGRRATKCELAVAIGLENALLHHAKLNFQDILQVFSTQSMEYDYLVDAVHELGENLRRAALIATMSILLSKLSSK